MTETTPRQRSKELRAQVTTFRAIIGGALGPRARITLDAEGWPVTPGRYGRLEWRGTERMGERRVYAFTDRARMITRLRAVPGVRPDQIGDEEAAVSMAAEDHSALPAVAALLRTRTRREVSPEEAARLSALSRDHGFKSIHGSDLDRREPAPVVPDGRLYAGATGDG